MNKKNILYYEPLEEKINIVSHIVGLAVSLLALPLLVSRAGVNGSALNMVSAGIFGASLIVLYTASTFYHSATEPGSRARLRIIDHASIYVLIAGTYTPITLITLNGTIGWTIFAISWALAVSGIILKLFFTGKFQLVSTLMYVFMGWIIVFAIKPLIDKLPAEGLFWLVAGGLAYTLGAVLYSIKSLKFNHAIFHVFVLVGSICHFVSIYFYVL
jgi:hemolysin III